MIDIPDYYFIDFDETIFNHMAYIQWLERYLIGRGIKKPNLLATIDDYHEDKGDKMRLYRHKEHIEDATGLKWSVLSADIEQAAGKLGKDFCYPDAHEAIFKLSQKYNNVRILTYGDDEYQRYKIRTCSVISALNIPIHVVGEHKRDFLKKQFGDTHTRGVLVDDKHPLNLPDNWQHIWIHRNSGKKIHRRVADNTIEISSLCLLD